MSTHSEHIVTPDHGSARAAVRKPPPPEGGLDYARSAYATALDWYKTAERKGQLLLTAHGAFTAILFGVVSSNLEDLRYFHRVAGVETWVLLTAGVFLTVAAIGFASTALMSRHRHNISADFDRLGIHADKPLTYKEEAGWYFGHIATLEFDAAVQMLREANSRAEFDALTYNLVGLAQVVLRKHRLVNAGWALTAAALSAVVAAAVSLFLRSQL